jgi:dUTP pyrophosphatase
MLALIYGRLRKATPESAGFDLFATEDVVIPPQRHAVIGTGVSSELRDCFAVLFDRSGLAAESGVGRMAGLIDADYKKEWKVVLANHCGKKAYVVKKGDRIAQVVFFDNQKVRVVGEEIEYGTEERKDGFGSTGKN